MSKKEKQIQLPREFFVECDCGNPYHIVKLSYEAEDKAIYITTMTLEPNFWRRLKEAVTYLLGGKLIYSETITGVKELKIFCEFISKLTTKPK